MAWLVMTLLRFHGQTRINMPLSVAQKTIVDDPSRYKIAVCGRRFGKTYMLRREICKAASQPNRQVFAIYPTYRQGKQVLWEDLKAKLLDLRWVKKINESDLRIDLVNGSRIAIRGSDNYNSLRGVGLDAVFFDEFAMMDPRVWTEAVRPALADRQGTAMFVGTPDGRSGFAYDLWSWAMHKRDWARFTYTTLDGGNVPSEEILAAQEQMGEREFRQEFMASWESYSGLVYYNFADANILDTELPNNGALHIGMDFNLDPLAATIGIRTRTGMVIFDEIEIYGGNTQEVVQEIKTRYPNRMCMVYPDSSGAQRRTSSNTTDHAILRNAGFDVRVGRTNPRIRDRVNSVNQLLKNARGESNLYITTNCKKLIECLNKQTYKQGTNLPEKGAYDHMLDALGYSVYANFPLKIERNTAQVPQRWGVAVAG